MASWGLFFLAVSFHEFSHAWMAQREGDETAKFLGRLTLNPLAHIDPVGSILVPLSLLFLTQGAGPVFGWAKPVPINPLNLREGGKSAMKVALAGPVSNIVLGAFSLFMAVFLAQFFPSVPASFVQVLNIFSIINFALAVFNLAPFPPLDGSHIFFYLLPSLVKDAFLASKIEFFFRQWGLFLLLLFIITPFSGIWIKGGTSLLYKVFLSLLALVF